MKINADAKPQMSLLYRSFVEDVARVRAYGLSKYPDAENWRTTPRRQHYDALLRHVFAAMEDLDTDGDSLSLDEESGYSHLAHAACNIMFLIEEYRGGSNGTT
jgi:hypothetical protein